MVQKAYATVSDLSRFSYNRQLPLQLTDTLFKEEDGLQYYRISFASPAGGTATGIIVTPAGNGPFAGIIFQHGMPGSAMGSLSRAAYIASHNAIVLALDAPYARRSGAPLRFTEEDSVEQAQLIIDLQRATDILLSRKDVDPERVAYVGRSYGGAAGALFAAVEHRLHYFLLSVADGGPVAHFTDSGVNGKAFRALTPIAQQRWLKAMQPIEPARYTHFIKARHIFLQSGLQDAAVPAGNARLLHRAITVPKTVKWYDTGHELNAQAYLDQLVWLHEKVGTTLPAAMDADALPL